MQESASLVSATSDNYFATWDEIVFDNIISYIIIIHYDIIGLATSPFVTDIVIMALQPVVSMMPLAEKTQIFDCSDLVSIDFYNIMPHDMSIQICKFILFLRSVSFLHVII